MHIIHQLPITIKEAHMIVPSHVCSSVCSFSFILLVIINSNILHCVWHMSDAFSAILEAFCLNIIRTGMPLDPPGMKAL